MEYTACLISLLLYYRGESFHGFQGFRNISGLKVHVFFPAIHLWGTLKELWSCLNLSFFSLSNREQPTIQNINA